jgi:cytochrome c55X
VAAGSTDLDRLLRQDCGSCHGLHLTGGLGPPLTRQALAGRTPEDLRATILEGRSGTAMPAWRGVLTEREVDELVALLLQLTDESPQARRHAR